MHDLLGPLDLGSGRSHHRLERGPATQQLVEALLRLRKRRLGLGDRIDEGLATLFELFEPSPVALECLLRRSVTRAHHLDAQLQLVGFVVHALPALARSGELVAPRAPPGVAPGPLGAQAIQLGRHPPDLVVRRRQLPAPDLDSRDDIGDPGIQSCRPPRRLLHLHGPGGELRAQVRGLTMAVGEVALDGGERILGDSKLPGQRLDLPCTSVFVRARTFDLPRQCLELLLARQHGRIRRHRPLLRWSQLGPIHAPSAVMTLSPGASRERTMRPSSRTCRAEDSPRASR